MIEQKENTKINLSNIEPNPESNLELIQALYSADNILGNTFHREPEIIKSAVIQLVQYDSHPARNKRRDTPDPARDKQVNPDRRQDRKLEPEKIESIEAKEARIKEELEQSRLKISERCKTSSRPSLDLALKDSWAWAPALGSASSGAIAKYLATSNKVPAFELNFKVARAAAIWGGAAYIGGILASYAIQSDREANCQFHEQARENNTLAKSISISQNSHNRDDLALVNKQEINKLSSFEALFQAGKDPWAISPLITSGAAGAYTKHLALQDSLRMSQNEKNMRIGRAGAIWGLGAYAGGVLASYLTVAEKDERQELRQSVHEMDKKLKALGDKGLDSDYLKQKNISTLFDTISNAATDKWAIYPGLAGAFAGSYTKYLALSDKYTIQERNFRILRSGAIWGGAAYLGGSIASLLSSQDKNEQNYLKDAHQELAKKLRQYLPAKSKN